MIGCFAEVSMKEKLKFYGSLAFFGLYVLFVGYMTYHNYRHPNPRISEFVKTPVSWIDAFLGFMMGVVMSWMTILFIIARPYRKGGGSGPNGDDSDSKRRINLPILGKVISIEELKKMPSKGPVQLAPTGS